MTLVPLRNLLGFLVQILPCAILCFAPFTKSLNDKASRIYATIGIAIVVAATIFTIFGSAPLPNDLEPWRFAIQNLIFLCLACVLAGLLIQNVSAGGAQKLFTIVVVMTSAFLVTHCSETLGTLLLTPPVDIDEFMYAPKRLALLAALNIAFLVLMLPLMRYIGRLIKMLPDDRIWLLLCAAPLVFLLVMFFGHQLWISMLNRSEQLFTLRMAIVPFVIFILWWILRVAERVNRYAQEKTRLINALERQRKTCEQLESDLASTKALADELESLVREQTHPAYGEPGQSASLESSSHDDGTPLLQCSQDSHTVDSWAMQPVTIGGSKQAISFLAGNLLWAESLNRTRILHLLGGDSLSVDVSLAYIYEQLPLGHFAYCHRSIVVNLHQIAKIKATEITLLDDSILPASRRRYRDVLNAIESAKRAAAGPSKAEGH